MLALNPEGTAQMSFSVVFNAVRVGVSSHELVVTVFIVTVNIVNNINCDNQF